MDATGKHRLKDCKQQSQQLIKWWESFKNGRKKLAMFWFKYETFPKGSCGWPLDPPAGAAWEGCGKWSLAGGNKWLGGGPSSFIAQPHFLFISLYCWVRLQCDQSSLQLLPPVLPACCHDGLHPSWTVSQNKPFTLKLLVMGHFIRATGSNQDTVLLHNRRLRSRIYKEQQQTNQKEIWPLNQ